MARVIWTLKAADEYEAAIDYVARDAPVAARRLAQRIMQRIRSLRNIRPAVDSFPKMSTTATAS